MLDMGAQAGAATLIDIMYRRAAFSGRMQALMRDIDLLLLPSMHEAAPTAAVLAKRSADLEARYARLRFTAPFNMSGSPSLTLPGGMTATGMPLGFQIIGRHFDESLVLRAGHAFQQCTDWHQRRPPIQ
jgi:amidase